MISLEKGERISDALQTRFKESELTEDSHIEPDESNDGAENKYHLLACQLSTLRHSRSTYKRDISQRRPVDDAPNFAWLHTHLH